MGGGDPGGGVARHVPIKEARALFRQACTFKGAAIGREGLSAAGLPEVAFAGRSNVGKSSLINALTGRHGLVRTSRTPGRTQTINFFELGGRLMLVDLPGYGYARAAKANVAAWTALVDAYLTGRPELCRTCLLIDARRGPMASDRRVMAALDDAAVSYQVVVVKADKAKDAELAQTLADIERELAVHPAAHPEVIATSAVKGTGLDALRGALAALAAPAGMD
ncbi:MAG: ribosome biogenesis GTP-binding protein YihA/YsxC [Alphaproteobacteria bacterium]